MKNICDWNSCNKPGEYKAPVERDNSRKYRLLCLEHIREFNKNWNYFRGMDDQQIFDFIKSDLTWHKPTQNFSAQDNFFKILWNNALNENLDKNGFDKIIWSNNCHLSLYAFVPIPFSTNISSNGLNKSFLPTSSIFFFAPNIFLMLLSKGSSLKSPIVIILGLL